MSRPPTTPSAPQTADLVRPARRGDLDGLLALARAADAGMTNLPADRAALDDRLAASEQALIDPETRNAGAAVYLVLERQGRVIGAACVFARIGVAQPFYSYRVTRLTQLSPDLGKRVEMSVLTLVNDLTDQAEVGGLFVAPDARKGQAGRLMARSRYLFMARHRDWFGEQVIADLRGVQDADGRSPVWDALGAHFYAMDFAAADRACALSGTRFISDLGPKYPIYVGLLPPAAQAALGKPHQDGVGAERLLREEGFVSDGYVDIFDGGPTLRARIDDLKAIREARRAPLAGLTDTPTDDALVCAGAGAAFRVVRGGLSAGDDGVRAEASLINALGLAPGQEITHVRF
ncbi:arginine N-succinyltransferase [Caulobacter vibrioides]|uniref:Arginine N-succinyltransferase n=2 Tax=Caulobacter vibrioides TaxID=155892 RepID=Q9AAL6_CAUVC|nr:arginine N-succinyltransferase [Caulobacter vibrioides]YP_002515990.1 arginine N-succinyltransferase, beta chain [Caulobacter vibrioides NA1000]AAK22567.1 arginine N-succinyltransferase [Caulobacter vibrioides CB15]ACL94082.1 arginine N-succinyltransferase, beta chain [Caulobacter vibrioides NA1000]ATC23580.1 arginine N-succinyltransferase [Caulobacter vibrioides]ATC27426.1 arginine N-succinyltransferase [Caulobacter vibrioides]AZH11804.1 arginine N-succinyltransferase [Caulobacter vibrioi